MLNHGLAGILGELIRASLSPELLRWLLGLSFIGIALWALKPDTLDDEPKAQSVYGVFALTFVTFFLAEIGDKTQLATVALAARYPDLIQVVAGTTLGMLIADIPAVILGEKGRSETAAQVDSHHCRRHLRDAGCGGADGRFVWLAGI